MTGEAADAVAQKAAYNVAMVHPTDLNIRSDANEDSEVLATAHEKDELEVVAWDGDWMKVALGGDVYGYVNAYYVDYKTYYPTAETIEEEQARLSAEQEAAEAADYEVSDDTAETLPEETYEEPTVDDSSDTEEASYPDDSDETTWTEAPATDETVWTEAPAETEAPANRSAIYGSTGDGRHRTRRHRKQKRHIRKHRKQKHHIRKHRRPRHRTRRRRKQKRRTRKHRRPRRLRHLALVSRSRILPCSMSVTHMYGAGQVLQKGQTVPDLYRPYLQISGCICPELQSPESYGGTSISLDNLQPGDLLFYNSTGSIDHVAIYIGGGTDCTCSKFPQRNYHFQCVLSDTGLCKKILLISKLWICIRIRQKADRKHKGHIR